MSKRRKPASAAAEKEPTPMIAVSNTATVIKAEDLEGDTLILECVKIANEQGHKVARRIRQLWCWHCGLEGMLLCNGERTGSLFTERCSGIRREPAIRG